MKSILTTEMKGQFAVGVVAGFTAGILVSIVLGSHQLMSVHLERKAQIEYVSKMVDVALSRLEQSQDDSTRLLYLNRLIRSLDELVNDQQASSRLTFEEKEVLRSALPYRLDGNVAIFSHTDQLPKSSDKYFETVSEGFRSVPWLMLAAEPD